MAGRGQVSWLPGIGLPRLPGGSVSPPVAGANRARGILLPVTVAGPRRFHTGLPLTTDRMYAGESIPRQDDRESYGCFSVSLGDSKAARATVIGIGFSPDLAMRRLASSCSLKSQ
jgi:hypothetical protein